MVRPSAEITFGHPLNGELGEVLDSGEPALLRDLTDFDWDEVHLFNEGASRDRIEQVVGAPVLKDKYSGVVEQSVGFREGRLDRQRAQHHRRLPAVRQAVLDVGGDRRPVGCGRAETGMTGLG
ncbi:hypothetical protein ABQE48_21050 [Mycolicibacterium thermoresistibile]